MTDNRFPTTKRRPFLGGLGALGVGALTTERSNAQEDEGAGDDDTGPQEADDEGVGFPPEHLTEWGDPTDVGDGEARTFVTINSADQPMLIGLHFTADALAGLGDEEELFSLQFPEAVERTPFEWAGLDWNPRGHGPATVYDAPHFDVHFYLIPEEEVNEIPPVNFPPGATDDEPYTEPIPDDQFPPNHFRDNVVVPEMGEHLADATSPEWSGGEFTNSFIWGHWENELVFYEPMVTLDYLEGLDEQDTRRISTPERFPEAGRYPTEYTVRYHEDEDAYTLTLELFRPFEASEGLDEPAPDPGIDASLTVEDQIGDGETLLVEEASASVEYYVDAHYGGETSRTEPFDADSTQRDLEVALDPAIEEDTTVEVAVHAEEDDRELVAEEIEYTLRDGSLTVEDQVGDGETLLVEEAWSNVDYYLEAAYDGETSDTETFDADATQEDVELELDPPIEEDATVEVAVRAAEDDAELAFQEIQYTLRTATLSVTDQTGDGTTLLVDEAWSNVDYYVDAHADGETSRSDTFDADATQTSFEIQLAPPIGEDATVEVAVHAEEDDAELVAEEIEYTIAIDEEEEDEEEEPDGEDDGEPPEEDDGEPPDGDDDDGPPDDDGEPPGEDDEGPPNGDEDDGGADGDEDDGGTDGDEDDGGTDGDEDDGDNGGTDGDDGD